MHFPENQVCSSRQPGTTHPEAQGGEGKRALKSRHTESAEALPLSAFFEKVRKGHHWAEEHPFQAPALGTGEEEGAGSSEAQVAACSWQRQLLIFLGWLYLSKSTAVQEGNFSRD